MTASAAILGMLPIACGSALRSRRRWRLRSSAVCDLDVLTLFVVPCVYSGLDDLVNIFQARRQK